jgi:hypothetical protein
MQPLTRAMQPPLSKLASAMKLWDKLFVHPAILKTQLPSSNLALGSWLMAGKTVHPKLPK